MFAMALLGKIKHVTPYSSKIAHVCFYHVTYLTRESAILATGFHVGQVVFHQEVPDSLKQAERTPRDREGQCAGCDRL